MIPDWITLSQTAGTGNATITVTASSYTELLSRSAAITVSAASRSATVTFSQTYDNSFSVTPTRIVGIPSALTYNYLDINADTTWEIYSAPDWMSFSEISGSGVWRVTALATGNTGTTRNGYIYIRNSRGIERTVFVEQVGAGQSVDTISVSPVSAFFPSSGDSVVVTVTADAPWTVSLPAWIQSDTLSGDGNTTVTLTATANTAATLAGYVVFSTANDSAQVSVSQDGYYVAPTASTVASANTIDPTGSTESNGVTANVGWTATTSAPWIVVSPTYGDTGYTGISISAGVNGGYSRRTGYVYIRNRTTNTLLATIEVSQSASVPPTPTTATPLTFQMLESGSIVFKTSRNNTKTISYSKDNGDTWSSITASVSGAIIPVNEGDVVIFSGNNSTYEEHNLISSSNHNVYGNIMSLVGENEMDNYCFQYLFYQSNILNANNLFLPSTSLTVGCYCAMFEYCHSLVSAPELPATTLAPFCYQQMFNGCDSLTTAPSLPATTLYRYCYHEMFSDCLSLTVAPNLPATNLEEGCYKMMFFGCTSLATAPALPATMMKYECYFGMFGNCSSLTTAPDLPAVNLKATDGSYTPQNYKTYNGMFSGCENLNYVKCLALYDIDDRYTTYNWLSGVSANGTFVKASGATWTTGNSGIPNGWTVQEV